jgi:hypothetical protein
VLPLSGDKEPGWIKSTPSSVSIAAFLAAIGATLFILLFTTTVRSQFTQEELYPIVTLLIISICCFALASEKFTDSVEFRNVSTNVFAVLAYDVAIALFLSGLTLILVSLNFILVAPITAAFSSYWAKDAIWLVSSRNRHDYEEYLKRSLLDIKRQPKNRIIWTSTMFSFVSGSLAILLIVLIESPFTVGQLTESITTLYYGFVLPFIVGYFVAAGFYSLRPEFNFDGEVSILVGFLLYVIVLVLIPGPFPGSRSEAVAWILFGSTMTTFVVGTLIPWMHSIEVITLRKRNRLTS